MSGVERVSGKRLLATPRLANEHGIPDLSPCAPACPSSI
jgi:hypothetical protein